MKLNLTDKQRKSLMGGKSVQLKHGQIGSGLDVDLHPMIQKKLAKAHMAGKGMRLSLSGGEIDMNGGKLSLNKVLKKVGVKKLVNKNVTEKNVAKYALKGYNAVNKQLEKQGMPSIHGAILNEGLNYVPFLPSTVKDVGAHYANKYIDKALDKQSEKVGAGVAKSINRELKKLGIKKDVQALAKNKKVRGAVNNFVRESLEGGRLVNPYIPSSYLAKQSGGKLPMSESGSKVYDDYRNILRPDQAGFKADPMFDPFINNDVFKSKKPVSGAGFKIGGKGINIGGAGLIGGRKRKY